MRGAINLTKWLLAAIVFVLIVALAALLQLGSGSRWASVDTAVAAEMTQAEFERRVRAFLLANPEVIAEALQKLEARNQEAERAEAKVVLKARSDEIFRDSTSPVGGNDKGDVTLAEFHDYNCPYCRRVAPIVHEAEAADKQLRVVYKEFPILGPNSLFAAKAALAAHRQGKYVAFHQALMQLKAPADEQRVLAVAATTGLDVGRLKSDMADPAIQAAIDRNLALARALRIDGTPGFVIGEQIVRGAIDLATMQQLIREAREKK
ncbi:MAG: DsbA family protein [Hyphomicrobiaceae bacterium]|nr:MAG: DsbA family protein [Hyphomicrobiaceae bacterium]